MLEQTLANRKRPDGTLYDDVKFPRGYWEAKDTQDNLDAEIQAKIRRGYPLTNTIFEDTQRAVLPYYIASLNIEHAYYDLTGDYEPFEDICFTDTLDLAESQQLSLFAEENTERVQRQKNAEITVVIGNPPYNVGQRNTRCVGSRTTRYPSLGA